MTEPEPQARVRAYESDKERINDLRQGDDTQADVIARLLDGEGTELDALDAEAFFERLSGLEDIAGENNEQREQFRALLQDMESQLDRIEAGREQLDEDMAEIREESEFTPLDTDDLKAVTATPEDLTQLRAELLNQLDRIEEAATTAEDRAGSIQNLLEGELR